MTNLVRATVQASPVSYSPIINVDKLRVCPNATRMKGLCEGSKLLVVYMGDSEIYGAALEVKTVTGHASPFLPQIFVIRMRAVSGNDKYFLIFSDSILDVTEKVDNFDIDRFYFIGKMTPHEMVDLVHGITVIATRRIIFYIKSFAGMNVIKIKNSFLLIETEDLPAVAGQGDERHNLYKIPSCYHSFEIPFWFSRYRMKQVSIR
jgi:hypothetical protein